ncbi:hypothetical protein CNBE3770 [Cryptococcus deneoformans B-3501A]|uniref:Expressed protein n=1 Tax=Cryptococcus deneoformans (strain JEC21 / ATCC MYA-565) TaxID=214684 RepID=Q5KGF7_CRYD1|nr:expressed protein [Cryptococcus neoformans var. neoformans JEC21]XP_775103.1 hypothetical protein CNBE3770 [Cryptococcus neoformans var. neoformans B-3501A]AAW43893.1 expressed protein [Cryptococcus neoformans var. neoformans JEC21]EAL20456.1 hypothetical protein CNBE3770 [Cryptococcus neoformans var. neoformans B-3501A]
MSSSKRRPQNPSDAERGSPTTSSPSYLSSSSRAPGRKSDYFNYHPPFSILLLEFIVWLLLFFVCFLSPNGGLAAVVKSDDEYVGVLRSCTKTSCDGWMQSSSYTSSDTNSRRSFNSKRDLTSTIDLSNFFLTTGLAALSSFWLMTYTFLFTFYRFCSSTPSNGARDGDDGEQEDEDMDEKGRRLTRWRRMKRSLKRFAFRVSRIYVFMLGWIVFGVACAASWQVKMTSSDGGSVGTGVLLLHASWILLFLCSFVEISRGNLRKRVDTGWGSCTCIPFFGICKRRGFRKWGKSGDGGGEDKDVEKQGKRGRSRRRRDEENSRSQSQTANRKR